MPLAYKAPTTLPALVPATKAGAKPLASSILMTPMCAKPLAAPPPSAMPILRGAGSAAEGVAVAALGGDPAGALAGVLPQAVSPASVAKASDASAREIKGWGKLVWGMRSVCFVIASRENRLAIPIVWDVCWSGSLSLAGTTHRFDPRVI